MTNAYVVHPELCAEALRTKHYWAYAFTSALKALDPERKGWVSEGDARLLQKFYGWSDSKFYRTLADAKAMTWIGEYAGRLYLSGPLRIAKSLGVTRLGGHSVKLSPDCMKSNDALKAAFLKAYLHDKGDSPLSQAFIRSRTGIPERTQRHYLNRAKDVYRIANYVVTTLRPEDVVGARENGYDGAFVKDGRVIVQAPNTYKVQDSGQVSFHSVKSTRQTNTKLRALTICDTGQTPKQFKSRLWFDGDESFYASQKAMSRGKVERRPYYNILSYRKRSSDGLIHIQEWDRYDDPLFP